MTIIDNLGSPTEDLRILNLPRSMFRSIASSLCCVHQLGSPLFGNRDQLSQTQVQIQTQLQIQMLYKSITSCFPHDIRVSGFNFHQIHSCIANCIDFTSFDIFPKVKMSNANLKNTRHILFLISFLHIQSFLDFQRNIME